MFRICLPALLLGPLIAASAEAADPKAGAEVFAICQTCHQIGEDAENSLGPQLNGVIGRKAGSIADFDYSDAMRAAGLVWDRANLASFLKDPARTVPGNKMSFTGLDSDEDIDNVLAFLGQFAADGERK
jgi:cytochrome c